MSSSLIGPYDLRVVDRLVCVDVIVSRSYLSWDRTSFPIDRSQITPRQGQTRLAGEAIWFPPQLRSVGGKTSPQRPQCRCLADRAEQRTSGTYLKVYLTVLPKLFRDEGCAVLVGMLKVNRLCFSASRWIFRAICKAHDSTVAGQFLVGQQEIAREGVIQNVEQLHSQMWLLTVAWLSCCVRQAATQTGLASESG